jgi:uncharacterized protein GlcG (DUF336 family)
MKVRRAALAAAIAAVMGPHAFAQQSTQRTVPAEIAATLVHEAVLKCRADGYKVTAKVVDASNAQKAFLRDDGAGAVTTEIAQMKINSVLLTGLPSGSPSNVAASAPPPASAGTSQRRILAAMVSFDPAGGLTVALPFEGAIPIKVGNELLGVLAVSGAPGGDKDVACANAALAKVADKLK